MNTQQTDKKNFNLIFRELRKNGFTAKQNFLCCQSCGWSVLEDEGRQDGENIVFYHKQDSESFKDSNLKRTIYLAFSGDGHTIKKTFEKHGYKVDWNGTNEERIGIQPKEEITTKTKLENLYK
jgi:hypothetical protein